jgi:hypothetical protein
VDIDINSGARLINPRFVLLRGSMDSGRVASTEEVLYNPRTLAAIGASSNISWASNCS